MNSSKVLLGALRKLTGGGGSTIGPRLARTPFLQGHSRKMSDYASKIVFKPVHLDEMPVPQGSWAAHYKAKNSKYNLQLLFGIIYFFITMTVVTRSGVIFFNAKIPPLDEDGEDEDDACAPPPVKKC